MTNGIISFTLKGKVLMKIIAGCNGTNAQKVSDKISKIWPVNAEMVYEIAIENDFGSSDCLTVLTESETIFKGEEILGDLYRSTFSDPKFNPRWGVGLADCVVITDVEFSMEKFYMFRWLFGRLNKPTSIVAKPTSIRSDKILFHFFYGHSGESSWVKRDEILAIGDEEGTVEVVGWSGKYKILNEELFNKNVEEGFIELKRQLK